MLSIIAAIRSAWTTAGRHFAPCCKLLLRNQCYLMDARVSLAQLLSQSKRRILLFFSLSHLYLLHTLPRNKTDKVPLTGLHLLPRRPLLDLATMVYIIQQSSPWSNKQVQLWLPLPAPLQTVFHAFVIVLVLPHLSQLSVPLPYVHLFIT